jgi:hypothetical protein
MQLHEMQDIRLARGGLQGLHSVNVSGLGGLDFADKFSVSGDDSIFTQTVMFSQMNTETLKRNISDRIGRNRLRRRGTGTHGRENGSHSGTDKASNFYSNLQEIGERKLEQSSILVRNQSDMGEDPLEGLPFLNTALKVVSVYAGSAGDISKKQTSKKIDLHQPESNIFGRFSDERSSKKDNWPFKTEVPSFASGANAFFAEDSPPNVGKSERLVDAKGGLSFEQPDKTFDFQISNDERLPTFKPKKQLHKRNKTEQNLSDFNILGASGFDAHQKDLGVD